MNDPNRQFLEAAVTLLEPLLENLVFVGGCATGLLITDPAATRVRPTRDVDAITETASYAAYATLSDRLRALGLSEDSTEGAPTCRWRKGDLILDVMPTDERVLGFTNKWYSPAITAARVVEIAGFRARVITPVYFLATKLEAFKGRGQNDHRGSHDLEDLVTVIDGRPEIVDEVRAAAEDVRTYIAIEVRTLLETRAFVDALPGFLLPDGASQARQPILMQRLAELARS